MDKRYQIFVSSTFADLKEERQAVMQALLSLDHFPAGMELFPASDDDQWALIRGVIDDSDYYVLVIGGRYGSTNPDGIGYTEMEFDYAISTKKPILVFLHEHPEEIPSGKTDQNDALRTLLNKFRKKAETGRHVKYWINSGDLQAKVIQAISAETKRNPREGWVRAGRSIDPSVLETLRQENDQLRKELQSITNEPPGGADQYAGLDEYYPVTIDFIKDGDVETAEVLASWERIFFEVGPLMMEEATEFQMKARLSAELWRYDIDKFSGGRRMEISNEHFETIKIQLMALGLIHKSQRKHVPSDTNKYWSLTPYGEATLMKLRAIPKSITAGSLFDRG